MALQESKEERNHREKLHREKDELMALKYSLEQQNMVSNLASYIIEEKEI